MILLQFISGFLMAQQDSTIIQTPAIRCTGVYLEDGAVYIRWVPSTPSVWSYSNFYGYTLERCELDTVSGDQTPWKTLGDAMHRPITLEEWRATVQQYPEDDYLKVAGQAIHGERNHELSGLHDLMKRSDAFRNYYAAAMLAAEFSFPAAVASALGWADRDVHPGRLYVYRVRSLTPAATLMIEEGITSVTTSQPEKFPVVVPVQVYEGERLVEIAWDKRTYQSYYSAYNIYRSVDQGQTFSKLNQVPVAFTGIKNPDLYYYRDSLEANDKRMIYRVEGLTSFGTKGPLSDTIQAMGRDRTPPTAPFNIRTEYLGKGKMKITWDADPDDLDIAGFRISRSNEANEGFRELTKRVLPSTARSYVDSTCNELVNNYYYVGVFDHEGNVNVGFPAYGTIIDSVAPAPPAGLAGEVDTNGVVTLHWKLGAEPDLKGYYIHSANAADETFANRTGHPVQDTVWRDTIPLNVLTEDIYYKVVAVDMRSNYSGYSEMLVLKKPDKVRPVAPVFISQVNTKEGIMLRWYNSTSMDAKENILERKAGPEKEFRRVYTCTSQQAQGAFMDRAVQDGEEYTYRLTAKDDSGLFSTHAGVMRIRAYVDKTLKPLDVTVTQVNKEDKSVTLTWTVNDMDSWHVVIYRSLNGSPYVSYKSLQDAQSFLDRGYRAGDKIRYKIKWINAAGWASDFSREVTALFPPNP